MNQTNLAADLMVIYLVKNLVLKFLKIVHLSVAEKTIELLSVMK